MKQPTAFLIVLAASVLVGCALDPDGPVGRGPDEPPGDVATGPVVAGDAFTLRHLNHSPTRLAEGPDGRIYVTDARAGSVFVYSSDLELEGELANLDRPLGVVVDARGTIIVGSDGRDSVEAYAVDGRLTTTVFEEEGAMPNDLALDDEGNLYVVDSRSDMVRVFTSSGEWSHDIGTSGEGDGELDFPSAVAIGKRRGLFGSQQELFVADLGNARVQVFDLDGTWLRGFGEPIEAFSTDWVGRFGKLQSLAVDDAGRLHALDTYTSKVQVLDPEAGEYVDSYGEFGTGEGQLNLPLDLLITTDGRVIVTNSENHRVEVIHEL